MFEKTKINEKEAGVGPFLKKDNGKFYFCLRIQMGNLLSVKLRYHLIFILNLFRRTGKEIDLTDLGISPNKSFLYSETYIFSLLF